MKQNSVKILTVLLAIVFLLCGCGKADEINVATDEVQTSSAQNTDDVNEQPPQEIIQSAPKKAEIPTEQKNIVEPQQEEYEALYEEERPTEELKQEQEENTEKETAVSLAVDCSDILGDIESLKEEKRGLAPDSGILFSSKDVEYKEGDSVFDVLKRALTAQGVHLEFSLAPVTKSAYIEGIGNIYEFDCGERSGWKYSVNGEFPRVGCSDFKVKPGDKIVFVYKRIAY